jgi:hypothetical protein
MARRATGVSENRRRFEGVGFGITSGLGPYVVKIFGNGNVRRFSSAFPPDKDTPAIRRIAPRTLSLIVMMFVFEEKM